MGKHKQGNWSWSSAPNMWGVRGRNERPIQVARTNPVLRGFVRLCIVHGTSEGSGACIEITQIVNDWRAKVVGGFETALLLWELCCVPSLLPSVRSRDMGSDNRWLGVIASPLSPPLSISLGGDSNPSMAPAHGLKFLQPQKRSWIKSSFVI